MSKNEEEEVILESPEDEEYQVNNNDYYDDLDYDDYERGISNDANVVKIWLDTESHLNKIWLFLENKQLIDSEEEGPAKAKQIKGTRPRATPEGINDIMTTLSIMSKDLVQSNLEREHYNSFMARNIKDIGRDIVINRKKWEMKHEDMRRLRRLITNNFELFFTRPIQDKERERFKGYNRGDYNQNRNKTILERFGGLFNKSRGRSV